MNRELYQGLGKAGFKLNYGDDNSGFVSLLLKDFGGYYIGTCVYNARCMRSIC
jgi:hypothetical protein